MELFDQERAKEQTFLKLCDRMIDVGEFLLAHDVARAGLRKNRNHKVLSQRAAHAICKAGSPKLASKILEDLVASGGRGVETQSLLASCYKDLCEYSTSEESKFRYADLAIALDMRMHTMLNYKKVLVKLRIWKSNTTMHQCGIHASCFFHNEEKAHEYAPVSARDICRKLRGRGT